MSRYRHVTCRHCGTKWAGTRLEHCVAVAPDGSRCCQTFTGSTAGDEHRIGQFHDGSRRCLTIEEMITKGMTRDEWGYWRSSKSKPMPMVPAWKVARTANPGVAVPAQTAAQPPRVLGSTLHAPEPS